MQDTVCEWGKAMIENETKKGEANRTLRRKNQLLNEERASLEYKLKQADTEIDRLHAHALEQRHTAQHAARELADRFALEVQLTRSWIAETGIPMQFLDSMLSAEFKGPSPSQAWRIRMNADRLSSAIDPNDPPKQAG